MHYPLDVDVDVWVVAVAVAVGVVGVVVVVVVVVVVAAAPVVAAVADVFDLTSLQTLFNYHCSVVVLANQLLLRLFLS